MMEQVVERYRDWSQPQRQSPAAIFVLLVKTCLELLKSLWVFLLIVLFRGEEKKEEPNNNFLYFTLAFLVLLCVVTIIKYFFYKFYLKDGALVIHTGWLRKKTTSVPIQNIHAVHLEQNFLHRLFNVYKLVVDSAGSDKAEAQIDALSKNKAEQLKQLLLSDQTVSEPSMQRSTAESKTAAKLTTADLLRFSLSSNHLETFIIITALALNLLNDITEALNIDSWDFMESYFGELAGETTIVISIIIVAVALISIIVSIIRTVLKFYNFTIEDVQQGWKLSYGLINHQQKIIPHNKIQVFTWQANWLRRKLNFWILRPLTIGESRKLPSQRLQVPVTSLASVLSLVHVYQNSAVLDTTAGNRIEPAYWRRKFLLTGLPVTIVITTVVYFWIGLGGLSALLLILYFRWRYIRYYAVFRWMINDEGLQLYSGTWGRKYSLLTWNKIQQVHVHQNYYQQNHDLATIIFVTAGGRVIIPYIQLRIAIQLMNFALYNVESREANWM
jgi:putative membrane protein